MEQKKEKRAPATLDLQQKNSFYEMNKSRFRVKKLFL